MFLSTVKYRHSTVGPRGCRPHECSAKPTVSFPSQTVLHRRLKLATGESTPNPACGFVDNSPAKKRRRTGTLAVEKSQETATSPPRAPLPTSSTGPHQFLYLIAKSKPIAQARTSIQIDRTFRRAGELHTISSAGGNPVRQDGQIHQKICWQTRIEPFIRRFAAFHHE